MAFIGRQIKAYNDSVSAHHRRGRRTGKSPCGYHSSSLGRTRRRSDRGNLPVWLDVNALWVAEALCHRGHGRRLMGLVEEAAIDRGCRHAQVTTFEFQARGFYERLGYQVFDRQKDYPPGQTFYWLCKELMSDVP